MEVGCACGEAAEDGALDFADVVEISIDQGLAEVGGGFAIVGRQAGVGILLAYGDLRQVAHIQAAEIHER